MDMENHKWDHKQEKNPVLKQIRSNGLFLTGRTMINFVNDYFVNIATALTVLYKMHQNSSACRHQWWFPVFLTLLV